MLPSALTSVQGEPKLIFGFSQSHAKWLNFILTCKQKFGRSKSLNVLHCSRQTVLFQPPFCTPFQKCIYCSSCDRPNQFQKNPTIPINTAFPHLSYIKVSDFSSFYLSQCTMSKLKNTQI